MVSHSIIKIHPLPLLSRPTISRLGTCQYRFDKGIERGALERQVIVIALPNVKSLL